MEPQARPASDLSATGAPFGYLPAVDRSQAALAWILSALMLALFLGFLDQTIVTTALSSMARELDGWSSLSWVVAAYLVAATVTTPIYGRLSDLHGRRPVLLAALALFIAASALCALATSMTQLIAARVLQGLGGGGLWSVSHAIAADVVPPRQRGRYQGYFSGVLALANMLGPVLGGACAAYLSWRWIFWINLPLGGIALLLASRHLRALPPPLRRPRIDWLGGVLVLVASTSLLLGLALAAEGGAWGAPGVLGWLALGGVGVAAVILWEGVAEEPLLPLRLFRSSIFSVASAITFLALMVMLGLLVLMPLDYQLAGRLPADAAGLRMLPITCGTVLGSFAAGRRMSRTGRYRVFPLIGTAMAVLGCVLLAECGLGRSLLADALITAALGLALGCLLSPLTVIVQNTLDQRDLGIGMSCLMFWRLMGGACGVALLSTILAGQLGGAAAEALGGSALTGHASAGTSAALLAAAGGMLRHAFSAAYLTAAGLLLLAFLLALALEEIPLRSR